MLIFSDPCILNKVIHAIVKDYRGQEEKGRGKGVTLDILTHFWHEAYNDYTAGSTDKVPIIRHDLQKDQWQSIARVIIYGYSVLKYFALRISPVIICTCLFGEESLTKQFLLDSFRAFVTQEDRMVIDECFTDDCNPHDEDVLDFLSTWKCCKVPTKENIKDIIFELAHQELVQKPRYVVHCWSSLLKMLQYDTTFKTQEGILQMYENRKPSAKKVIKLLHVETTSELERLTLDHLKRYIRSLEGKALERFLHFISGSDCIACDSIEITFNGLAGLQRRLIAHTCAPSLEISTTYESFGDLASEFNNILKDDQAWSFDIV